MLDDVLDAVVGAAQELLEHILLRVVDDDGDEEVGELGQLSGLLDQVLLPLTLNILQLLPLSLLIGIIDASCLIIAAISELSLL